jgi:hypothetical protein
MACTFQRNRPWLTLWRRYEPRVRNLTDIPVWKRFCRHFEQNALN